ncbi:MAG: transketolase family protein [Elusimicrobia bacterium]|nr:transketolase family protein [Elusimicrobiota bacterium]
MDKKIAIRDGYGKALAELGKEDPNIIVVSADLEDANKILAFREAFPDRFYTYGIAEQDMIGAACGFSLEGFTVFANSFAVFMTNRAYDQIRMCVCYNNANVKLVGSHGGITVGPDGGSAQCLEDYAIMRALPNMKVISPCDALEAAKATRAISRSRGPVYMRTARPASEILTKESDPFTIGKANILREGKDAVIIGCGLILGEALSAADMLETSGISAMVVNMHTLKPVDEEAVINAARKTGAVVTVEEHQVNGGLGSAVCEVLSRKMPVPVEMVAVKDTFGESGEPEELLAKYALKDTDIAEAVRRAVGRRRPAG